MMERHHKFSRKRLPLLLFSRQVFIIFSRSCHRWLRHSSRENSKLTGRVANLQMNRGPQLAVFAVALVLTVNVGCIKKKPQLPPQAKAPAEPIATPLPPEISETVPPPAPPQPNPQPEPSTATVVKPPKKRARKKVPAPNASVQAANPTTSPSNTTATSASNSATGNNTTVAMARPPANPAGEPTPDPAITPDVSSAQLRHQKQSTAQLLEQTEKTINGLKGASPAEDETLAEIRSYVNQSRKATSEGDFERAYNLATKAHLLCEALVKK